MTELSLQELKERYKDFGTVGRLIEFIEEHKIPMNAKILVQRVEDVYYDKYNWSVVLKKGESWHNMNRFNEDLKAGVYDDKDQYPDF
jgi:hypothetical protein